MEPPINLYAFVMARLDEKLIPQKTVAAESGVPFSTVSKIAQRAVTEPSVHTIQRLYDYFVRRGEVIATVDAENAMNPVTIECSSCDPRHGRDRRQPDQRKADRRKEAA